MKNKTKLYLIALIGPHGVGKTTVGRLLSDTLSIPYDYEIGGELRKEMLQKSSDNHALQNQPLFDQHVISQEIARDKQHQIPRIVETWHPGNMAYALHRSPEIATYYLPILEKHLLTLRNYTLVQPLRMNLQTAFQRLTEPGPTPIDLINFFAEIAQQAEELCLTWHLTLLPPIYTDISSAQEAVAEIIKHLP